MSSLVFLAASVFSILPDQGVYRSLLGYLFSGGANCHNLITSFMQTKVAATSYPHMPIGKVWIYWFLFVCFLCVCLYGYGFLRQGLGITHFGKVCSLKSPKSDESASYICGRRSACKNEMK